VERRPSDPVEARGDRGSDRSLGDRPPGVGTVRESRRASARAVTRRFGARGRGRWTGVRVHPDRMTQVCARCGTISGRSGREHRTADLLQPSRASNRCVAGTPISASRSCLPDHGLTQARALREAPGSTALVIEAGSHEQRLFRSKPPWATAASGRPRKYVRRQPAADHRLAVSSTLEIHGGIPAGLRPCQAAPATTWTTHVPAWTTTRERLAGREV
jgi:hypothetical protein